MRDCWRKNCVEAVCKSFKKDCSTCGTTPDFEMTSPCSRRRRCSVLILTKLGLRPCPRFETCSFMSWSGDPNSKKELLCSSFGVVLAVPCDCVTTHLCRVGTEICSSTSCQSRSLPGLARWQTGLFHRRDGAIRVLVQLPESLTSTSWCFRAVKWKAAHRDCFFFGEVVQRCQSGLSWKPLPVVANWLPRASDVTAGLT